MTTLFESWTQCQGNWKSSSIYLQVVKRDTTVRKGVRRWMIWKEVVERFGEEGAAALVEYKKNDEELAKKEIRPHPSAPNVKELSSSKQTPEHANIERYTGIHPYHHWIPSSFRRTYNHLKHDLRAASYLIELTVPNLTNRSSPSTLSSTLIWWLRRRKNRCSSFLELLRRRRKVTPNPVQRNQCNRNRTLDSKPDMAYAT